MITFNETNKIVVNKLQKYFLEKDGSVIERYGEYTGMDNFYYGDAYIIFSDGSKVNIDFKQDHKKRGFIPIELVQINSNGTFSSWLYNGNIKYVLYQIGVTDAYLFQKSELLRIAKFYTEFPNILNTSTIISKYGADRYKDAINYYTEQLKNVELTKRYFLGTISPNDIHINVAFNYKRGEKTPSGLCLNIPIGANIEKWKI